MGAADIATVLFTQFLKYDAADPKWPDRDRFVLSAGHGSMLLYALLYLTGNAEMTLDRSKNFRQLGSRTAGHPKTSPASGVETTTGPLGQGPPPSAWRWRKDARGRVLQEGRQTTPTCLASTAT